MHNEKWYVIINPCQDICADKNGQIPEWPKGTDCKSAATCFGGSNPPLPIIIYAGVAELADAQDLKSCCSDTVPVRFRSPALRGLKCWSSFSIWGFLFLCWDKKNPPAHRSCGRRIFSVILFFLDWSLISCGWFTLDQCSAELCAADWNVMYQGV